MHRYLQRERIKHDGNEQKEKQEEDRALTSLTGNLFSSKGFREIDLSPIVRQSP